MLLLISFFKCTPRERERAIWGYAQRENIQKPPQKSGGFCKKNLLPTVPISITPIAVGIAESQVKAPRPALIILFLKKETT